MSLPDETKPTQPLRVLSGMRPTGRLHLGNYMGALYNWVRLQNETNPDGTQKYECFFFIADYHALTTDYADPSALQQNIYEVALDFLSAGLDPERSTIFVQSDVPAHFALNDLLAMITPLSWLERVPTYKDQQEQLKEKDLATFGFLGYPLLQSADILLYQPKYVPVGQDQAAHVEITREIARRFNQFFPLGTTREISVKGNQLNMEQKRFLTDQGRDIDPSQSYGFTIGDHDKLFGKVYVFDEPLVLLTPSPKLPGLDGRKMSKSYGNTILLSDRSEIIEQKMSRMSNGGQRNPQSEPGDPDICPVGDMHRLFSSAPISAEVEIGCRTASMTCIDCKNLAAQSINNHVSPIREKRNELDRKPEELWKVLDQGAARAAIRANATMQEVRIATGLARPRVTKSTRTKAYAASEAVRTGHDIKEHENSGWGTNEWHLLTKGLRDYWLRNVVPQEIRLTVDSDAVFVTERRKRVFVMTSIEGTEKGRWSFASKPKSYEILALLCLDEAGMLHDFIIAQSLYITAWSALKKRAGKGEMHFSVAREGSEYVLLLGDNKIPITSCQGSYEAML